MCPKLRLSSCLIAFFASGFQAFGMYNIHALSDITEGGIFGLVLLFDHWFGLSPAISSLFLNLFCYGLGLKVLGKDFIGYSVVAALGYSSGYAICQCFPPLWPQIANFPLLAAILGALFIGIGAGWVVRIGGATTGDDALAMSIRQLTGLGVEKVYLVSDLTVLLLSLSYIPLQKITYSLLTVILSGQIIGWMQKPKVHR